MDNNSINNDDAVVPEIESFINESKEISNKKLIFLKAIANTIKSGMDIVGVSIPEKM